MINNILRETEQIRPKKTQLICNFQTLEYLPLLCENGHRNIVPTSQITSKNLKNLTKYVNISFQKSSNTRKHERKIVSERRGAVNR